MCNTAPASPRSAVLRTERGLLTSTPTLDLLDLFAAECDFTGTDEQPAYQHTLNLLCTTRRHHPFSMVTILWAAI